MNWENAGITNDTFLNESILDDYQAIYRAYANQMRGRVQHISAEDLKIN